MARTRGVLLDLDGTVYEDDAPLPGAAAAIASLRAAGIGVRFVTNTTRVPRETMAGWLEGFGVPTAAGDIFTPARAAAACLAERGRRRVAVCLPRACHPDFAAFEIVDREPEAVVIGDLGSGWTFEVMNRVFRWLRAGADFLALHRNRYWKTGGELVLDVGSFVAAFEHATGREATLVGKPSRPLFEAAARSMGLGLEEVAMVGDDLRADVAGSQALGIRAVLVRTGNSRNADLETSGVVPDAILDSLADLPDRLGG